MAERGEEFPKPVGFLPDQRLSFSYLRSLETTDSIKRIWIPRFPSKENIDSDERDVLELSIGFVPTTEIEMFIAEWKGKIISFEFTDEVWEITAATDQNEIDGHVFAYQMKPYVTLQRIIHARELEEKRREME